MASVEFYKPYANRDVLRDDGMVAIASALRAAEGKEQPRWHRESSHH
jgi:hypothetical protein